MENNEKQKTIEENILATIKCGRLKMRPRWHFALKAMLVALGGVILALTVLYLASFIIFALKQTGVLFMPAFGMQGWLAFFTHLPVFLIFLLIIFIVILELMVRHYAFAYRRPLLYSAMGILVLAIAGVYILEKASFHKSIFKQTEKENGSFTGMMYREYGRQRFIDVHRGYIMEINQRGFLMNNQREEILTIIVTRRTRLPYGADFSNGDMVVVFGHRNNDAIQAVGIQEVEEE